VDIDRGAPRPGRRRLWVALAAGLAAAVVLTAAPATAAPAAAAPAAPAGVPTDCSPWTDVPSSDGDADAGFVDDRHSRISAQVQHCPIYRGGPRVKWYARTHYEVFSPDTQAFAQEAVTIRLGFDRGCVGCDTVRETVLPADPPPGGVQVGDAVHVVEGLALVADVRISYLDAPSPLWWQTGVHHFVVPTR